MSTTYYYIVGCCYLHYDVDEMAEAYVTAMFNSFAAVIGRYQPCAENADGRHRRTIHGRGMKVT